MGACYGLLWGTGNTREAAWLSTQGGAVSPAWRGFWQSQPRAASAAHLDRWRAPRHRRHASTSGGTYGLQDAGGREDSNSQK